MTVNIFGLVEFLSEMTTSADMKRHPVVEKNMLAVEEMSNGEHLWSSMNPEVVKFAMFCKAYMLSPSCTQLTASKLG